MIKKINVTFTQKFKQMRLQLNKKVKLFFFHCASYSYTSVKICHDERMFDICSNFNTFLFFYLQPWPLVVRSSTLLTTAL